MHLILLQNWQVCSKTHSMLKQLLGVDVLGRTRIYNWFGLEVAEMSNDNDERSGLTSITTMLEKVATLCKVIPKDNR
jgi:hypothetical protein